MYGVLAYADSGDSGNASLMLVLAGAAIVAVMAVLACVVIILARRRGHRQADGIMAAAILWGVLGAGSLIYTLQTQMSWSREYNLRLSTGYLDPADVGDAPKLPWGLWGGMGVAYVGMVGWAGRGKRVEG
jgi:hypothetical protein